MAGVLQPANQLNLVWHDHCGILQQKFLTLFQTQQFCDVSLACEGQVLNCHRIILSACSEYFDQLFAENAENGNSLVICLRELRMWQVQHLVEFMYSGEVLVGRDQLREVVEAAKCLKVRGLEDIDPHNLSEIPENDRETKDVTKGSELETMSNSKLFADGKSKKKTKTTGDQMSSGSTNRLKLVASAREYIDDQRSRWRCFSGATEVKSESELKKDAFCDVNEENAEDQNSVLEQETEMFVDEEDVKMLPPPSKSLFRPRGLRYTNLERVQKAAELVLQGVPRRRAAAIHDVPKTTVFNYVKRLRALSADNKERNFVSQVEAGKLFKVPDNDPPPKLKFKGNFELNLQMNC